MELLEILERTNLPFKENKMVMEEQINKYLGITDAEIIIDNDKIVVKGTWSYIPRNESVGKAITEVSTIYSGYLKIIPSPTGGIELLSSSIGRLENIGLNHWQDAIKGYLK